MSIDDERDRKSQTKRERERERESKEVGGTSLAEHESHVSAVPLFADHVPCQSRKRFIFID
jgi:hypothetical protein